MDVYTGRGEQTGLPEGRFGVLQNTDLEKQEKQSYLINMREVKIRDIILTSLVFLRKREGGLKTMK